MINAKEAIKEFEREYQQDIEDVVRQERKEDTFRRGELLGRFTARKIFGWSDKRYNQEYWRRIGDDGKGDDKEEEEPWKQWKKKKKKSTRKIQESESGQKKTKKRWATWLTCITSCRKIPRDKET